MKKIFLPAAAAGALFLGASLASAVPTGHSSGHSGSHFSGGHASSQGHVSARSGGWNGGSRGSRNGGNWGSRNGGSWSSRNGNWGSRNGGWGSRNGGRHGSFRGGRWGFGWGGWGGWGWGWGWGWPGYPGYWDAYYGPGYGYGYGGYGGYGGSAGYAPGEWGSVKTDVSPEEARVFLDGRYIGTADDFDGFPDFLYLKPGRYRLEFRLDGFETQGVDIEARPGVKIKIDNKLRKVPGARQYGSYDTPEPEGGVRRYFGKEKDRVAAIDIEARRGSDSDDWRGRDSSEPPPDADADDSVVAERPQAAPAPEPPRGDRSPMPPASAPGSRARIRFHVEPGDAAVYVDDRFAGTGEELSSLTRGFQVPPGIHKVVVSRPGYSSESTQVEARAGRPETVEISLERP